MYLSEEHAAMNAVARLILVLSPKRGSLSQMSMQCDDTVHVRSLRKPTVEK